MGLGGGLQQPLGRVLPPGQPAVGLIQVGVQARRGAAGTQQLRGGQLEPPWTHGGTCGGTDGWGIGCGRRGFVV